MNYENLFEIKIFWGPPHAFYIIEFRFKGLCERFVQSIGNLMKRMINGCACVQTEMMGVF